MLLVPQLLLLGLMALGTLRAAPTAEAKAERVPCPAFWFPFDGRCYKYVPATGTWAEAERNCVSQGANLASVHSREEHEFVQNLSFDGRPTWIGLSDAQLEGWWMWSDGSRADFAAWQGDEPDGGESSNCVATSARAKWADYECSRAFPSVCELRAVCP